MAAIGFQLGIISITQLPQFGQLQRLLEEEMRNQMMALTLGFSMVVSRRERLEGASAAS
jgi:hypothetical protein